MEISEQPLGWEVQNCEQIILAIVCIHNFLIDSEMAEEEHNRRYVHDDDDIEEDPLPQNPVYQNPQNAAEATRNTLTQWCIGAGDRQFQYDRM